MKRAKFSILLISFLSMITLSLSPIIAKLTVAFPQIPVTQIQQVMTLPSLVGIPTTLVSGLLMTRLRKKPLLLVFLFLSILGTLPLFIHNSFGLLLVVAILLGVFTGSNSVSNSLINELFDGDERDSLIGLNTGIGQCGAVFFSLLGGALATRQWYSLYAIFLVPIPVFILAIFFLPRGKKPVREPVKKEASGGVKGIGGAVIYIVMMSVFFCALYSFVLNNSLLLAERGFDSPALAGITSAVGFAAGGIFGFFFGRVSKCLGRFLMPLGILLPLVGFAIFAFTKGLVLYTIASAFIGLAMSIIFPATINTCSAAVPPQVVPLTISLVIVGQGLGSSTSAVVITALASMVGLHTATEKMLVSLAAMCVLFVIHMILALRRKPAVTHGA